MKVIYYCHTGAHTSLMAAAIHLGMLPIDRIPTNNEITQLPFFNKIKMRQLGRPFYLGDDNSGNKVYALGLGFNALLSEKAMHSFLREMNISDKYTFINIIPQINRYTLTGTFISVMLSWDKLALPLILYGLKRKYNSIVEIVEQTKNKITINKIENDLNNIIPFPVLKLRNCDN